MPPPVLLGGIGHARIVLWLTNRMSLIRPVCVGRAADVFSSYVVDRQEAGALVVGLARTGELAMLPQPQQRLQQQQRNDASVHSSGSSTNSQQLMLTPAVVMQEAVTLLPPLLSHLVALRHLQQEQLAALARKQTHHQLAAEPVPCFKVEHHRSAG